MAEEYSGISLLIVRKPMEMDKGINYYPHYYDSGMKDFPFLIKKPSTVIANFNDINTLEDRALVSAWCNLASAKSSVFPEEAELELIANLEGKFNGRSEEKRK